MVGDDPQPHVVGVARRRVAGLLAVALAGQLGRPRDDGVDLVDLVEVVDALEQGRHALQAHAGVDVALRQRAGDVEVVLRAHRRELLLHEHEVPELEVAVLVDGRAAVGAVLRAAVEVDLAAGATRAGNAHVPVVVELPATGDARLGHADAVAPDRERLVVVLVDGRPDQLGVEAVAACGLRGGDQLPGEGDGPFLEVVAEREVAVHLEERAVPGGLADLLDVTGAHALLHAGRPDPLRGLLAEEVGLEGHHAGVDEQQVRVVVDQRRGGDDGVAVLLEERQPATPDLSGFHVVSVLGCMGATGHGHATSYAGPRRWSVGWAGWAAEAGARAAPTELARRSGRGAAPAPPRASASGPGRRRRGRMPGWPVAVRRRSQPASTSRSGVSPTRRAAGPGSWRRLDRDLDRLAQLGLAPGRGLLDGRDEALGDGQLPQGVADPDRRGGEQHGAAPHARPCAGPRIAVRTP